MTGCQAKYLVPRAPGEKGEVKQDDLRTCELDAGHDQLKKNGRKFTIPKPHRVDVSDRTDLGGIPAIEWWG